MPLVLERDEFIASQTLQRAAVALEALDGLRHDLRVSGGVGGPSLPTGRPCLVLSNVSPLAARSSSSLNRVLASNAAMDSMLPALQLVDDQFKLAAPPDATQVGAGAGVQAPSSRNGRNRPR